MIVSAEVGYEKPDVKIFGAALGWFTSTLPYLRFPHTPELI